MQSSCSWIVFPLIQDFSTLYLYVSHTPRRKRNIVGEFTKIFETVVGVEMLKDDKRGVWEQWGEAAKKWHSKKWHTKYKIKMSQVIVQIYKLSHPALRTKLRVAKVKHHRLHIALPVNQSKLGHSRIHAKKDDGSTRDILELFVAQCTLVKYNAFW